MKAKQFIYTFVFPHPNRHRRFSIKAGSLDEAERHIYARATLAWIEKPCNRKARILKPKTQTYTEWELSEIKKKLKASQVARRLQGL